MMKLTDADWNSQTYDNGYTGIGTRDIVLTAELGQEITVHGSVTYDGRFSVMIDAGTIRRTQKYCTHYATVSEANASVNRYLARKVREGWKLAA